MKKYILILSALAFSQSNMLALTGVKFENNTGVKDKKAGIILEAKIDNPIKQEWVTVEPGQSKDLLSKTGDRKIYWKKFEADKYKKETVYSTKESYSMPHIITINEINKYDMVSGVLKTKKTNLTTNSMTQKIATTDNEKKILAKQKELLAKQKEIEIKKQADEQKLVEMKKLAAQKKKEFEASQNEAKMIAQEQQKLAEQQKEVEKLGKKNISEEKTKIEIKNKLKKADEQKEAKQKEVAALEQRLKQDQEASKKQEEELKKLAEQEKKLAAEMKKYEDEMKKEVEAIEAKEKQKEAEKKKEEAAKGFYPSDELFQQGKEDLKKSETKVKLTEDKSSAAKGKETEEETRIRIINMLMDKSGNSLRTKIEKISESQSTLPQFGFNQFKGFITQIKAELDKKVTKFTQKDLIELINLLYSKYKTYHLTTKEKTAVEDHMEITFGKEFLKQNIVKK